MPNLATVEHLSLVVLLIVATIATYRYRQESQKRRKLLSENPEKILNEARNRGNTILHRALKKAQEILGQAELEGVKAVAESKFTNKKLEEKYQSELAKLVQQLETSFSGEISLAEKEYLKYLEGLRAKSEQTQLLSQEYTKQRINEIFERFEQNLAAFLTSTEQKSVSAIELELKASRQLIDTYKTQQLALIDENVISMLEKTLSLVLAKKISLKDEMDLVYEALEKAKIEKFII